MGWIFDAAVNLGEAAIFSGLEQQIENGRVSVCRNCHTEGGKKDAYCKICGSKDLIRKDKFLKELEDKDRAARILEEETRRMELVFEELDRLLRGKTCPACITDYLEDACYCPKCGANLESMPAEKCELLVLRKHPWIASSPNELRLIKSERDQRKAEQQNAASVQPQKIDPVAWLAQKATRKTLKGIGKSLKFIGKAIDDSAS
jgi:hypothetical protein